MEKIIALLNVPNLISGLSVTMGVVVLTVVELEDDSKAITSLKLVIRGIAMLSIALPILNALKNT